MSSNVPISQSGKAKTAPTPVNTPLTTGPLAAAMSRPTVPDIDEVDDENPGPASGLAGLPASALAGLVHGKLAGLIGKSSGYIESLPAPTKRNVEALKGVQTQYVALQQEYKKECLELEAKYWKLWAPVFARRKEIVTGEKAPTAEEVTLGEAQSLKDDPEYSALPATTKSDPAGVPEFWLTALRNHVGISDLITERDAPALASLVDITVTQLTAPSPGFRLTFHFAPNEFFSDAALTKTYIYQAEVGYGGDYVYDHAEGCPIKWKDDSKDLTRTFEIKKQRNKNTNRTRLVRKAAPADSFFNFFAPPVPPAKDALDADDADEDELEDLEERLEFDYQIGEDLKERIIPRAVDYFTGKALEYEDLDDDYEDDDDEGDDDDEDADDDDDDE